MNRRLWLILFWGFATACLASTHTFASLEPGQILKLPGGHTVKILSITKIEYSKGVMAVMVRYQTNLSLDQRTALVQEVDDFWKIAVKDVDHYGYNEAILSSNEIHKGLFLTASRMLNFIFEKGPDGKWTRLSRADVLAFQ
ncbi:MAG TPA: hypothetical protein VL981_04805 [Candidatus Methylacidiphilales bacterium]|nr:hypothetical protein [Candidatus Methylacidiphilales bacterium]